MTIGICAISVPEGYFVAVSDQMLSYQDVFPATDNAAKKTHQIAQHWHAMFAGDPVAYKSVIRKMMADLKPPHSEAGSVSAADVMRVAEEAYAHEFHAKFVGTHLTQLGYKTVDQFRREGLVELGKDIYGDYHDELAKFDLNLELLVFGHDEANRPWLFDVANPGRAVDKVVEGYSVIGSGYHMAVGSLRHKPLFRDFEDLIYRLLEAKFVSETATGVGRGTTLVTVNSEGMVAQMKLEEIEGLRKIWEQARKEPIPPLALQLISGSRAVSDIAPDGER